MADALGGHLAADVEHLQVTVLAGSIDEFFLLPEASDGGDVALEVALKCPEGVVAATEVVYLDRVVHAHYNFAFVLCDLNAVRGRVE